MRPVDFVFTAGLLGVTAACITSNATPTIQSVVPSHTPAVSPVRSQMPSLTPASASTPVPTPSLTPTSLPGAPQLIQPGDGAVLPQPVPPDEWFFSWTARTGPCHGAITVVGPGGRRFGSAYVDWYLTGYRYSYSTSAHLPEDALGPWSWFVDVICPSGSNRSEMRVFWVATVSPPAPAATTQPGLDLRGQVRLTDGSGVATARLCRAFAAYPGEAVATTDQDGYYQAEYVNIPGDEMVGVWAELEGYSFEPKLYYWRHYHGHEVRTLDFVAIPTTATDVPPAPCR